MNRLQFEKEFNGWQTPNTYDTTYADPPQRPGIYILTRFTDMREQLRDIVYVGSASKLLQRYERHEVRRILQEVYGIIEFWFTEEQNYVEREKELIRKYQPKFNKQWR